MKSKSKSTEKTNKSRGLFDHINHIRETKNSNYYASLTDEEKSSFNKYMIVRVLSMDQSLIEEMAFVSKYFDIIPPEQFYKLLIDIVPKGRKFCKYIKKSKEKINQTVLSCLTNKFKLGERDVTDYYNILISNEAGIKELISIVEGYGYSEKEVEKLFE